jgi:FlaA1/EpsC-like NDP-sugar epimerase
MVVAVGWLAAFYLRFNLSVPDDYLANALSALVWVMPIYATVFLLSGLYRGFWRFASLTDLVRIAKSVLIGATAVAVAAYLLQLHLPVPRSVILLSPLLLIVMMGGARATYRIWREKRLFGSPLALGKPLLILGAGRAGASLVRELQTSSEWRVVGLLDDDPAKQGREVIGHKVIGTFDDLERVAERLQVRNAIIAIPKSRPAQRQRGRRSACALASRG